MPIHWSATVHLMVVPTQLGFYHDPLACRHDGQELQLLISAIAQGFVSNGQRAAHISPLMVLQVVCGQRGLLKLQQHALSLPCRHTVNKDVLRGLKGIRCSKHEK